MFFIVGPTGVGKSEIAAEVACRCGGEIIGADAFQVYEWLDILTAKPSAELRAKVPHHLVGVVPLVRSFDVGQFVERAGEIVTEITARGKIPIVVGGTGLYVRAITHGLADLPQADAALRAELEATDIGELHRRLAALDPVAAEKIDAKNKRRLIRAVEVCVLTGKPFSSFREDWGGAESPGTIHPASGVLLNRDRDQLYERIDARVTAMFREGVVDEVRTMESPSPTASQVLGLKEIRALIAGEMDETACIEAVQRATRHYAKRQLTWFRREPIFDPINLSALTSDTAAKQIVQRIAELRSTAV